MTWIRDLMASPDWSGNPPADENHITQLSTFLNVPLPESFKGFLKCFDGGRGGLGEGQNRVYIMSISEMITNDVLWNVRESLPKHILFGTDCGDFGLLFDVTQGLRSGEYPVVMCPVSSLASDDVEAFCDSFPQLFTRPFY